MKRREFITGLSGAAIAWPVASRAQQSEQLRRIGVVMGVATNDPGARSEVTALKQGLQDLGWAENYNLQINYSWSDGEPDRMQASAKELVGLHCEVIVARSTPVAAALLKETRTMRDFAVQRAHYSRKLGRTPASQQGMNPISSRPSGA